MISEKSESRLVLAHRSLNSGGKAVGLLDWGELKVKNIKEKKKDIRKSILKKRETIK